MDSKENKNRTAAGLWWASLSAEKLLAATSMILIAPVSYGWGTEIFNNYYLSIVFACIICALWYVGVESSLDTMRKFVIYHWAETKKFKDVLLVSAIVFGGIFLAITVTTSWWAAPIASDNIVKTPTVDDLNEAIENISTSINRSVLSANRSINEVKKEAKQIKKEKHEGVIGAINKGTPRWRNNWERHMIYARNLEAQGRLHDGAFKDWYIGVLAAQRDSAETLAAATNRISLRAVAKDSLLFQGNNLIQLTSKTFSTELESSLTTKANLTWFLQRLDIALGLIIIVLTYFLALLISSGASVPSGKYTLVGAILRTSSGVGDILLGWAYNRWPTSVGATNQQTSNNPKQAPTLLVNNDNNVDFEVQRLREQVANLQQTVNTSQQAPTPVGNKVSADLQEEVSNTSQQSPTFSITLVEGEPTIPYKLNTGEIKGYTIADFKKQLGTYIKRSDTKNNRQRIAFFEQAIIELENVKKNNE